MQVGVDVTYMQTKFGGCSLSGFRGIAIFKFGQFSPSDLIVHGSEKIGSNKISLNKFMQVGVDVKCVHTPISVGMASPVF